MGRGRMRSTTVVRRRAARRNAVAAPAVVAAVAALLMVAGCSDDRETAAPRTPAASTTTSSPAAPAGAEFSRRLAAVKADELVLGEGFDRQFLTVQFLAVGLDATESACAVDRVIAQVGTDVGRQPVGRLLSGGGMSPDVLLACIPMERVQALAAAGAADLSRVPAELLRSTLDALAVAGYEAAGLTTDEADCLSEHVVGTYADADLVALMSDLDLSADRAVAGLQACVTSDRADQLGG